MRQRERESDRVKGVERWGGRKVKTPCFLKILYLSLACDLFQSSAALYRAVCRRQMSPARPDQTQKKERASRTECYVTSYTDLSLTTQEFGTKLFPRVDVLYDLIASTATLMTSDARVDQFTKRLISNTHRPRRDLTAVLKYSSAK